MKLKNNIISIPLFYKDNTQKELQYEHAFVIKKDYVSNKIMYTLLRQNGQIYEAVYDSITKLNSFNICVLSIEEQIDAFNKHFFKFINPPKHLKQHIKEHIKNDKPDKQ